jgi:twitching motility protein PilT
MPEAIRALIVRPRGLLLVTGPTGSGKTTSLASMINFINDNYDRHIITLEDPIEYFHKHKKCTVNQREIGVDVPDFKEGIRRALRMDPDVILVGEMRDLETISLAITAAETGHLVFGTLHTTDAPQTVDRIIDVFEPDAQQQVRMQLSTTLQAVLSQTLLPRADGNGRVAAFELMVATPAIRTLIREGKTYQMYTDIQTGAMHGMQTLDSHLLKLVMQKLITFEDGQTKSSNPADFEVRYKRALERGTDLTEGA